MPRYVRVQMVLVSIEVEEKEPFVGADVEADVEADAASEVQGPATEPSPGAPAARRQPASKEVGDVR